MLGHELIHADRIMRGVAFPAGPQGEMADTFLTRDRRIINPARIVTRTVTVTVTHTFPIEEWATIGLGYFTEDCITENMLRLEHGLDRRVSWRGRYR